MLRMLVVDDMYITRKSILNLTSWEKYSIEIVGDASNGKEAIDIIQKFKPDIVVTDVKMPVMDGLELSKYIYENCDKRTKVIIISAYNEFELAKQALKYKVSEYVLKPINKDNLLKAILDAKSEIEKILEEESNVSKTMNNIKEIALEKLIGEYLNSVIDKNIFTEKLNLVSDFKKEGYYTSVELLINDYYNITSGVSIERVGRIVKDSFSESLIYFKSEEELLTCILRYEKETDDQTIESAISGLKSELLKHHGLTISAFVGNIYDNISDILKSFNQSKYLYERKLQFSQSSVIFYDKFSIEYTSKGKYPIEIRDNIITYIKVNETTLLLDSIKKSFDYFREYFDLELFYRFFSDINTEVVLIAHEMDIEKEISDQLSENLARCIKQNTLALIEQRYSAALLEFSNYLHSKRKYKTKIIIYNAKEIIKKQYQDKEMSLESISGKLFLNTNYFCHVFKNETGETFIEYLTKERLKRAFELLKYTDLKIYEIADKVGFSNQYYFTKVFTKHYNISPSKLRQNE